METFLIRAAQLILAFAILVIIHEFGHFIFSRIFGVRVEKFYLFFDPWFEIFKWKPKKYMGFFGKTKRNPNSDDDDDNSTVDDIKSDETIQDNSKKNLTSWKDTEYGIGWLPLGGYCKIAGMIDESMDKEQMSKPPKPWEFRSKPAWQRLLIMIGGVLFNFILAILIYAGIAFCYGDDFVEFKDTKGMLVYSDKAQEAGFKDGDIPLTADGKKVSNIKDDLYTLGDADIVTVLRNGTDTVAITLPEKFMVTLDAKNDSRGLSFMTLVPPTKIKQFTSGSAGEKAGMKINDEIIAVNGQPTKRFDIFQEALKGNAGKPVEFTIIRTNAGSAMTDTLKITATLNSDSKLGFYPYSTDGDDLKANFNTRHIEYGFFESFPHGVSKGITQLTNYVSSMKYIFTKEGAQSVGGFGAIGSIFPETWDWEAFWNIAAFLSVALAFMNILPIPALDGGHVMFLLYEVITRRKPSEKFLERAQMIGMAILLLLLLYANGMDIIRLFQ